MGRIVRHQIVFLVYLLSNVAAVNNGNNLAPKICMEWVVEKVEACHIRAQPWPCIRSFDKFGG